MGPYRRTGLAVAVRQFWQGALLPGQGAPEEFRTEAIESRNMTDKLPTHLVIPTHTFWGTRGYSCPLGYSRGQPIAATCAYSLGRYDMNHIPCRSGSGKSNL